MGSAKARLLLATALMSLAACATAQAGSDAAAVSPAVSTEPTVQGGNNIAVVAGDGADKRIIGTAELAGLEIYGLDGRRVGSAAGGEVAGVDARSGFRLGSGETTVVASIDATTNSLRLFTFSGGQLREAGVRAVPLGFAAENVCLYRNAADSSFYAFIVGDAGEIDQQLIFATADGRLDARQSRRLTLPSTAEYCAADDATGQLYVSEEAVGLWRFNADPEADAAPALVDAPRIGQITDELGGIALHDGGPGARWLIASDVGAARLLVYNRANEDAFVKAVPLGTAVEEPGGLSAGALGRGALMIADEGSSNYKAFALDSLGIAAGTAQAGQLAAPPFPTIRARVETAPVPSAGDAADDPAIWANPKDPARSLVIGTDKRAGLRLYDMAGRELQFVADGKMNNVDLREGYKLGGKDVILVTASDRTNKAVAIYTLDPEARRLTAVSDGPQETGLSDPYGQCMYRSPRTGRTYVFISDPDGLVRQWELVATSSGKVRANPVRDVRFSSQTEGCVADDETGVLYVAEEDIGLWRLSAEPDGGDARTSVDAVATNPKLKDDMEGIGLYDLGGGRGYLVLSSQGNNSYAIYRREGDNAYLGSFSVVADGTRGIDGISETDGLEVSSRNLGPGFERGGMVAQDGRNVLPSEYQNFKYVSWDDIAKALGLESRR